MASRLAISKPLGMRLLRGRSIDRGDIERGERIVVVDEAFANAFFPGRDPIGQRVKGSTPPNSPFGSPDWLIVVGVV